MDKNVVLSPSGDIVVRKIEGEIIIVPITSGIGDIDDKLYSFNETGVDIWNLFDGNNSLEDITLKLANEYGISFDDIWEDVLSFSSELVERKILVQEK